MADDPTTTDIEDTYSGHAPADTKPTTRERAAIDSARVSEGEPARRGLVTLPPIRFVQTPNCSSRNGKRVEGVVVHETEGGYYGAVGWLTRKDVQASAHVVLKEDGSEATQLVPWGEKAWHAAGANPHTLGIEIAGFTGGAKMQNNDAQIRRAARICGYWCERFDIPPVHKMDGHNGLTRHRDLGAFGGGHHDPGGFDWDEFVAMVAAEVERGSFRPQWGED